MSAFCILYGTHTAFTQSQLDGLYYNDKDYRAQVGDDVRRLENQHFLLPADGRVFVNEANHAHVAG